MFDFFFFLNYNKNLIFELYYIFFVFFFYFGIFLNGFILFFLRENL